MKKAPLVIISLLILVCLSGCGKKRLQKLNPMSQTKLLRYHYRNGSQSLYNGQHEPLISEIKA